MPLRPKLLGLAIALLFGPTVWAQTDAHPRTTVRLSRDTLYLGQIESGRVVLDSFKITNTGAQPYFITGTEAACDCAVLRKPNRPLQPGESAFIRFEFDSRSKEGPLHAGVILHDNSAPNARTILYLVGEILPRQVKKNPWDN